MDVLRISLVQCELVTACPIVTHVSNSLPVFSLYSPEDSSRVFPLHLLFLGLTKPISLSQPFLACCVLQPSPCGCCAPGVISQVANRGEKSLHVLSMFLLTKCSVRVACAAVLYHWLLLSFLFNLFFRSCFQVIQQLAWTVKWAYSRPDAGSAFFFEELCGTL